MVERWLLDNDIFLLVDWKALSEKRPLRYRLRIDSLLRTSEIIMLHIISEHEEQMKISKMNFLLFNRILPVE